MRIVIDAGHGGVWPNGDPGAVSGSKVESHFTYVYANSLAAYLHSKGYDTVLTRKQDKFNVPFHDRTSIATADDLFISIHFDATGGGPMIYFADYYHTDRVAKSKKFAEDVDSFLRTGDIAGSTTSRFNRLYIDDNKCPAILIEVDTVDKADESHDALHAFNDAVLQGIEKYLGKTPQPQDKKFDTPFQRVFLVKPDNTSKEIKVSRMSVVGDKLYIAPEKDFWKN